MPEFFGVLPLIWPVSVYKHFEVPIFKCGAKGCFRDVDEDFPIHVVGTLKFPNLPVIYVHYSEVSGTLFAPNVLDEHYMDLIGDLSLSMTDSKGFQTTLKSIMQVLVVFDANLFSNYV